MASSRFAKKQVENTIPTASMADIAFLLLIFFMVSTVFRVYQGLKVVLPEAEMTEKIETKRNITHIFTDMRGQISIDDVLVHVDQIRGLMYQKRVENPRIIVSLKTDYRVPYGRMEDIMEELKKADALRVNFSTNRER